MFFIQALQKLHPLRVCVGIFLGALLGQKRAQYIAAFFPADCVAVVDEYPYEPRFKILLALQRIDFFPAAQRRLLHCIRHILVIS